MDFDAVDVPLHGLTDSSQQIDAGTVQKMALVLLRKGASHTSLCKRTSLTTPLHVALSIGLSAGGLILPSHAKQQKRVKKN